MLSRAAGIESLTALGHNGFKSTARMSRSIRAAFERRSDLFRELLTEADISVRNEFDSRMLSGLLSVDDANTLHSDTLNRLLAHVGVIEYSTTHPVVVEEIASLVTGRLRQLKEELDGLLPD